MNWVLGQSFHFTLKIIIQALSSTLRPQQKIYKNKSVGNLVFIMSHILPTTAYILKKKQKVLWTNITDILDFLRNQKGGEVEERITLIKILYQQI